MKYTSTLIVVKDMDKAKQFYQQVLGLEIIADFGANVTLTGGITLQTINTWKGFIHREEKDIIFENNAIELYFEEDDMDSFVARLEKIQGINYVHQLIEHTWGQRVIRFYDTDKHIIEVGENIKKVVGRFIGEGLSVEQVALHMDVPISYVQSCLV